MRSSSDVDERTLRELYLRAFEHVVTAARPWTVMCAYNRVNGVYAAENTWLLSTVLREEWGFDGAVISDWGAVRDRVTAVAAGLDLEMPATNGVTDADVVAAVEAGTLDAAVVARAAGRVATLAARVTENRSSAATFDADAHHDLAREAAARSIVLLQNKDDLLPLAPSSLAVIGGFAVTPRYQGGGSSHVNPTRVDVPLEEIRRHADGHQVTYSEDLTAETLAAAADADAAVVFLGLAAEDESEGFDRTHIDLPADQLNLLSAVVQVQPRTVAVLAHGGVVALDGVAGLAPAILDGALLGQGGGRGIADVLFGAVNPSGRLAETVPVRLQDSPAYLNFPGEDGHILYGERVFVGYRWYDARATAVTFPFGHGLSYTRFDYTDLAVVADAEGLTVRVSVVNTGDRAGREVVQVYAGLPGSRVSRPLRWLVGFAGITVAPGALVDVEIRVPRDELGYWDVRAGRRLVEEGEYAVSVGASSRDLRLHTDVTVDADVAPAVAFTVDSTLGELLGDPVAAPIVAAALASAAPEGAAGSALGTDMLRMLGSIPVGRMVSFSGGAVSRAQLTELLDEVNRQRS